MTTLYAHRHVFESIFLEANHIAKSQEIAGTMLYVSKGISWEKIGQPEVKRPLESVILDQGIAERMLGDVKEFLSSQKWYIDRGIPYRRGYLLYGPPGTGKSSFIQALAGELNYGVAMINLSERGLTDDRLNELMRNLPARTLLLLEDADAAWSNRRKTESDGYNGPTVTFSGLLNALDGIGAGKERIHFLTTNHIDRLDAALIRPGRVDVMELLGNATAHQASAMWDTFYGDIDQGGKGRERFLSRLEQLGLVGDAPSHKVSPAAIQGLFVFNKHNMEGAIEGAVSLKPA